LNAATFWAAEPNTSDGDPIIAEQKLLDLPMLSPATQFEVGVCVLRPSGLISCLDDMSKAPLDVPLSAPAIRIAGSCALLQTGGVECWKYSEISPGKWVPGPTVTQIAGLSDAVDLRMATFFYDGCVRTAQGKVKCFYLASADPPTNWPADGPGPGVALAVAELGAPAIDLGGGARDCALLANDKVVCWNFDWYAPKLLEGM